MLGTYRLFAAAIISGFLVFFSSSISAQTERGTPILWEPVDIPARDLFLGPGGKEMVPDLNKVTLIKEEKGGASKKYRIRDGKNREWVAKIGREAQPETASVRLLWGIGFKTEINYLVPSITIPGKGTFKNVRLEARPEYVDRDGRWSWNDNPLRGSDQLTGLALMMAFLNNWDVKTTGNNIILRVNKPGRKETHYVVSDLGATFGRTGYVPIRIIWRFGRAVNNPEVYSKSKFIDRVKDGRVEFSYAGRNPELFDQIRVEDTRWITNLLSRLSDGQIHDAFRAANYQPQEIRILAGAVKRRINELIRINNLQTATK